MRRIGTVIALALVAAGVLALPAVAKEMSVSLAAGPTVKVPGDPWNAQLLVHGEPDMLNEATPSITIDDGAGNVKTFAAKATGEHSADGQLIYETRVVFPSEGRWTYTVSDGVTDRAYEGGSIQIGEPTTAPGAPASEPAAAPASEPVSAPTFPWPAIVGLALAFAAGAGALFVRRHRLREAS
jgi:hypothetical protein